MKMTNIQKHSDKILFKAVLHLGSGPKASMVHIASTVDAQTSVGPAGAAYENIQSNTLTSEETQKGAGLWKDS